jgi:hypothetical protein
MSAVQALTGNGGWPMSVFLVPLIASLIHALQSGELWPNFKCTY